MVSTLAFRPSLARHVAAAVAALAALALAPGPADAGKPATYHLLPWKVKLAEGVPAEVGARVEAALAKAIAKHPRLRGALPKGAPDPDAKPKAFERWAKRKRVLSYRLKVEVTSYEQRVTKNEPPRRGHRISAGVSLRSYGQHMPKPSMAFTGAGSATIKMDVGKRVRARDRQIADEEAIALAVDRALAESIAELDKARRKPKRRK